MLPSRLAPKEEYERDPVWLRRTQQAGGYRVDLWQYRYREVAFDTSALLREAVAAAGR